MSDYHDILEHVIPCSITKVKRFFEQTIVDRVA